MSMSKRPLSVVVYIVVRNKERLVAVVALRKKCTERQDLIGKGLVVGVGEGSGSRVERVSEGINVVEGSCLG